jgi:hypothetical protein
MDKADFVKRKAALSWIHSPQTWRIHSSRNNSLVSFCSY